MASERSLSMTHLNLSCSDKKSRAGVQEDSSYGRTVFYCHVRPVLPGREQERLLTIAKQAFAKSGFASTSVNAIAAAAGISIGTLYKYFRSKEDLFLTIIGQGHDLLQTGLEGIVGGNDPLPEK